jgi:mRNA-degrading endonuclease RelE of RelBE toxin-antitoxin system
MGEAFAIELTTPAYRHLEALRRYDRNRVLDAIKQHLQLHPDQETWNKKLLRENPLADWELRVQPFRVFYEVNASENTVRVVGIGVKERDKLFVGGVEIEI